MILSLQRKKQRPKTKQEGQYFPESLASRNPDVLSSRINPSAKVGARLQSLSGTAAAKLAGISGKVPADWPCAVSAVFAVSQPSLTIATEPPPASWSSSHTGRTAAVAAGMWSPAHLSPLRERAIDYHVERLASFLHTHVTPPSSLLSTRPGYDAANSSRVWR